MLYKKVAMVGIADFITPSGKEMENGLKESEDWPVFSGRSLADH